MYIVRNIQLLLGGLLLALVLFLGFRAYLADRRATQAQENYQAAAGDAQAATVYVQAHKEVVKQRRVKDEQVEKVLSANAAWDSEPVPDDVGQLLRHPSGATRAVP
ncbi:hypothetical protein [Xanthomonas translucens]|uniref:hypothetical protein n=1 Tax=Xanthomonas campestris pv. translucens TaxID=343 RepID=UPI0012D9E878|nr:hypothetical protein [Xanthomonas translucens]